MDNRHRTALDQVELGRAVFVLSRTKKPLANCPACRDTDDTHRQTCQCLTCHGFHAATSDPDRINAMLAAHPTGLLAMRTGAISHRQPSSQS